MTQESADLSFAVLHFGDHNLVGGVVETRGEDFLGELRKTSSSPLNEPICRRCCGMIDRYFGQATCSLRELFRDDQRRILDELLRNTRAEVDDELRKIYDTHAPLLRF